MLIWEMLWLQQHANSERRKKIAWDLHGTHEERADVQFHDIRYSHVEFVLNVHKMSRDKSISDGRPVQ